MDNSYKEGVVPVGALVRLDSRTRLMVPASIRRELHLQAGDAVCIEQAADGSLRITPFGARVSAAKGHFKANKAEGQHVVDEFLRAQHDEDRPAES